VLVTIESQCLMLTLLFRTLASSTLFGNLSCNVFFNRSDHTNEMLMLCFCYRIECMSVVKFHSDCTRRQGLSYVHC
jgi:hypothetical protein